MSNQPVIDPYATIRMLTDKVERLQVALGDLYALVQGECPSLLSEDSAGSWYTDERVRAALEGAP